MSIVSRFLGIGAGAAKEFVKKGAVATSDVLSKKVTIPGWNVAGLLKSPEADQFLARTAKQNAKIISDNIVRFNDGTVPHRVITKRLPSGTTIAQAFDFGGKAFKEVISKNVKAYSYGNAKPGIAVFVQNLKKGASYYKSLFRTKQILPLYVDVRNNLFDKVKGLTRFANADNKNYKALSDMGLVH